MSREFKNLGDTLGTAIGVCISTLLQEVNNVDVPPGILFRDAHTIVNDVDSCVKKLHDTRKKIYKLTEPPA